jgi:hypothetical protein
MGRTASELQFLCLFTKHRGVTAHSTVIVTHVALRTVQNSGLRIAGKAHECMNSILSLSVNLWCGEDGPELHFTKAGCVLQVSGTLSAEMPLGEYVHSASCKRWLQVIASVTLL